MAAEPQRPDGWIVSYVVEVVFDTSASRTRYDHVGTVARCTGCGDWLRQPVTMTDLLQRLVDPARPSTSTVPCATTP